MKKAALPRWLVTRQEAARKPTIAELVARALVQQAKAMKVRGVDLPLVRNRAEARARLKAKGPFQHFTARANPNKTTAPGRARRKREAARERART